MSSLAGNFRVNERLVKIIDMPDGSIDVLAYDDTKDEFYRNLSYLSMILYGREDIEELSEVEFEKQKRTQRDVFEKSNAVK
jgi:hypothetical protein